MLLRLRCGQISQGGRNGIEQRADQNIQKAPNHHIVGVQPGSGHPHKLGDQQIVRVEHRHRPDAVEQHGPHVAAELRQDLRRQRTDVLLPQIGIQPVSVPRDGGVLYHRGRDGKKQIIESNGMKSSR